MKIGVLDFVNGERRGDQEKQQPSVQGKEPQTNSTSVRCQGYGSGIKPGISMSLLAATSDENKEKYQLGDYKLIQNQILQTNTKRTNFSSQYEYNIEQTSNENKEKYQLEDYWLIQYQIFKTNITRTISQTVRRITNEILGVKGQERPPQVMYEENRKGQRLNMGAAPPTENGQKSMAFLSQDTSVYKIKINETR
ncbi:hypothetical protein pdam_00005340, partial [Pocillopora damicornis]